MTSGYQVLLLTAEEQATLPRVRDDLLALAASDVPSVRAAARTALAHIEQAMNGQGMSFELYTAALPAEDG